MTIDQLLLRSPNIRLSAKRHDQFPGETAAGFAIALNARCAATFRPNPGKFSGRSGTGRLRVVVISRVAARVDRPKTDLMDKLVVRDLRDLG